MRLSHAIHFTLQKLIQLACLSCLCWPFVSHAAIENNLNVYNWSNYIPDAVLKAFEKETGIHINYSTYDSNETLYAKLKANPNAGYDVVFPSTYFIDRMRRQGMLQAIDKTRLTNYKYLNPALLNKEYDPHNQYSLPFSWSTTAITVNKKYWPKGKITRWNDLWKPEYRDQLLLLDDTREVFSIALLVLGYSANDTDPEHIKQAYEKLKQLMLNVKVFNNDAQKAIYIDEDATIGMGWSGEINLANQENSALQFIYPEEGYIIAMDNMAIPTGAKHLASAYQFIDFILRPDIAKQIAMSSGYATPNLAALQSMPAAYRNNPITYPNEKILSRAHFQTDVGAATALYERYFQLLKIGGDLK